MVHLIRFADDFVVTGRSKELLEREVRPLVERFLDARGLELSQEKTRVTHIEEGFDFLGQNVRKYGGVLLITPSKKNVKAFLDKVRGVVKANKQTTAGKLVLALNPIIHGWALYHRHVASKPTFRSCDHAIFQALWRWARRRHPNKGARWVRTKYFRTVGGDHWVFHGEALDEDQCLSKAARVLLRRHVKVRAAANPFDPAWEVYFEQRLTASMEANLAGRRQLLHLWREQGGICPVCKQPLLATDGWDNHHIVWRSRGGLDTANNRVLLHPNCHRQVHSRGTTVSKPRSARGDRKA